MKKKKTLQKATPEGFCMCPDKTQNCAIDQVLLADGKFGTSKALLPSTTSWEVGC
jgi:hypothetical protein